MSRDYPSSFIKIGRVLLVIAVVVVAASCSKETTPDLNKNADKENSKPTQEIVVKNDTSTRTPTKEAPSQETEDAKERQPQEDEIAEDCVAFVRATKVVPAKSPTTDCPDCAAVAEAAEVLAFREFHANKISCSDSTCEVVVTIRVAFNPAGVGTVTGGLTAWLSQEQRTAYLTGPLPTGQQTFTVKVIYKRTDKGWRAAEFDKANSQ